MSEKRLQPSRIARSSALTQSLTSSSPSSSTSSSRAQSRPCFINYHHHHHHHHQVLFQATWPTHIIHIKTHHAHKNIRKHIKRTMARMTLSAL